MRRERHKGLEPSMSHNGRPMNGDSRSKSGVASLACVSLPLGQAPCGFRGRIDAIHVAADANGLTAEEIENRLLELGFVEGAHVEILHEGAFSRDPIAVRVNHATIALRRREAMSILATEDKPT
jgi:ferrous iron transport protein A